MVPSFPPSSLLSDHWNERKTYKWWKIFLAKNIKNLFENLDDMQTAQSFMPNESNVAQDFQVLEHRYLYGS